MKKVISLLFALMLGSSVLVFGDVSGPGSTSMNSDPQIGYLKRKTKKVAHRTKVGTKYAAHKTKRGTKVGYYKTKRVTKKTYKKTKRAVTN